MPDEDLSTLRSRLTAVEVRVDTNKEELERLRHDIKDDVDKLWTEFKDVYEKINLHTTDLQGVTIQFKGMVCQLTETSAKLKEVDNLLLTISKDIESCNKEWDTHKIEHENEKNDRNIVLYIKNNPEKSIKIFLTFAILFGLTIYGSDGVKSTIKLIFSFFK